MQLCVFADDLLFFFAHMFLVIASAMLLSFRSAVAGAVDQCKVQSQFEGQFKGKRLYSGWQSVKGQAVSDRVSGFCQCRPASSRLLRLDPHAIFRLEALALLVMHMFADLPVPRLVNRHRQP